MDAHGGSPDQGFFIHQCNLHCLDSFFAGIGSQQEKRRGPHNNRIKRIGGQADQFLVGFSIHTTAFLNNDAVVGQTAGTVPFGNGLIRPL